MSKALAYLDNISRLIDHIRNTQTGPLDAAAGQCAKTLMNGGWIYVFGTGHSHMLAEEMFYRAGGLVRVKPILEDGLMLHAGAAKSTELERLPGYAGILLDEYNVQTGDTLIIASNSGRNAVCIEMALGAAARGAAVIALTSIEHSSRTAARHPSGKRLFEAAGIILDNGGCCGDASVDFGDRRAAPTSTVIGAVLLNMLQCSVIELLQEAGAPVELYASSNIDGGERINQEYISKYKGIIKGL